MDYNTENDKMAIVQDNRLMDFALICIGMILVMRNLQILPKGIVCFLASWHVVPIIGGIDALTERRICTGVALLTIGGLFYLQTNGLIAAHVMAAWSYIPLIFK